MKRPVLQLRLPVRSSRTLWCTSTTVGTRPRTVQLLYLILLASSSLLTLFVDATTAFMTTTTESSSSSSSSSVSFVRRLQGPWMNPHTIPTLITTKGVTCPPQPQPQPQPQPLQLQLQRRATTRQSLQKKDNDTIDIDGMGNAPYIMAFILLTCIWNFTIPTEFRRARFCTAEQVIANPNSNCKTVPQYIHGIQEYYTNGGSVFKFDFSIDREDNIWITGPKEIME